jgi:hypothetical protein
MSEDRKKSAMDELLREGAKSYLDAQLALIRFKQKVTEIAVEVFKERLSGLAHATEIEGLRSEDIWPYYDPDGVQNSWDGNWGWLSARIWMQPWRRNCHLGLHFERSEDNEQNPHVIFRSGGGTVPLFNRLNSLYRDHRFYYENSADKHCGFSWSLENPLLMRDEFGKMMDHVIEVWNKIGGWRAVDERRLG